MHYLLALLPKKGEMLFRGFAFVTKYQTHPGKVIPDSLFNLDPLLPWDIFHYWIALDYFKKKVPVANLNV